MVAVSTWGWRGSLTTVFQFRHHIPSHLVKELFQSSFNISKEILTLPLHSPFFSPKPRLVLIVATWIIAMAACFPELIAFKLVKCQGALRWGGDWIDAFEESFPFKNYPVTICVLFFYLHLVLITILHLIIALKTKSMKTLGEQSINARAQRLKRERTEREYSSTCVASSQTC